MAEINRSRFRREVAERQIRVWIDKATERAAEPVENNWQKIEARADIFNDHDRSCPELVWLYEEYELIQSVVLS
ncbi:MAG: hypothetical protein K0A99_09750 [Desulfoarculaceae bacterium]|nr:hypothetical protein [Desulfoarculaceae bacterium]